MIINNHNIFSKSEAHPDTCGESIGYLIFYCKKTLRRSFPLALSSNCNLDAQKHCPNTFNTSAGASLGRLGSETTVTLFMHSVQSADFINENFGLFIV